MSKDEKAKHLKELMKVLQQLSLEQVRYHRIDAERLRLALVLPDEILNESLEDEDDLWIDLQAVHPNDLKTFIEQLDLHPLIVEDCMDPHRSSRFSSYDKSLHFELPVFIENSTDDYLSVICVPGMLITIRTAQVSEIDRLLQDLNAQQLNDGTKSALLYTILNALAVRLVQAAGKTRDEIRRLSHAMDSQVNNVEVSEIISVKRRVQDITTIAEDQLYCISALISVDSDAFHIANQQVYLRDATRDYEAALRVLHRYEARAAELHQQYLFSLQARTESRIRILTILSSICMPLTLIAGIYGMNFSKMPELNTYWGYPAALLMMLLITVGQLWFYHKRGWFG